MLFNVFRIVRSEGPQFTTEVRFIKFGEVEAPDSELALAGANHFWPERLHHMAVEPANARPR